MKLLASSVLFLSAATVSASAYTPDLVLDKPSVVVLYTPEAEISPADQAAPGFLDFLDDFQTYQISLASVLHDNRQVEFISTTAQLVRFKGTSQTVSRKGLGGYGIVVFVPGRPPAVFEGVATDHEVLCELQHQLPAAVMVQGCEA